MLLPRQEQEQEKEELLVLRLVLRPFCWTLIAFYCISLWWNPKKHVIMSITLFPYRFAPFIFKLSSSESSNITKSAFFDALRFCLLVFFFCLVGAGLFSESFGWTFYINWNRNFRRTFIVTLTIYKNLFTDTFVFRRLYRPFKNWRRRWFLLGRSKEGSNIPLHLTIA